MTSGCGSSRSGVRGTHLDLRALLMILYQKMMNAIMWDKMLNACSTSAHWNDEMLYYAYVRTFHVGPRPDVVPDRH